MSVRIQVLRADITTLDVDAVVNAANEGLLPGGGVCGAIHGAAGPELAAACRAVAPCATGDARLTPGFALPARHVVHAVVPVWRGGAADEPSLLARCYRRSLEVARDHGLSSLAFPAISTGIFGYPLEAACRIAVGEIRAFLAANDRPRRVILCAFDETTEAALRAAASEGEATS